MIEVKELFYRIAAKGIKINFVSINYVATNYYHFIQQNMLFLNY